MPTKVFDAFTRLDASDVNAYLANKSISNAVINGAFDIWQRGTSFSSVAYTADRWRLDFGGSGAAATVTRETFTPGAAPVAGYESAYFTQIATTAGTGTSNYVTFEQRVEDVRSFAGQTATISLWAKATSGSPKLGLEIIQQGTGANVLGIGSQSVTLSNSWERYSFTYAIPALTMSAANAGAPNLSHIVLNFWLSGGSDLNARSGSVGLQSSTFQIWGVQLEPGTVANDFRRNANSLQGELAACQRYYEKSYNLATALGANDPGAAVTFYGTSDQSGNIVTRVPFAVQKRTSSYTLNVWGPTGTANVITYNRSGASADGTAIPYRFSQNAFHVYTGIGVGFVAATAEFHFAVNDEL
jgi:hypothetical protein